MSQCCFGGSPRHIEYLAAAKILDALHDKQGLKLDRFPGLGGTSIKHAQTQAGVL